MKPSLQASLEAPDLPLPQTKQAVRVAFFSDSLPERNGTGAYYHDLLSQLATKVEALEIFQPLVMERHPLLSLPMPGDPSQRLVTPDVFRIGKAYKALNPNIVVAITPGPFGLLGLYHAWRTGAQFIAAFHTDFEHLARIYWNPFTRVIINGYLRTANKVICRNSATVLINNSNLEKDVTQLGAKSVEVMGTPLQPSFIASPIVPPSPVVKQICFAGRLAAEKNIDRIIEAAVHFPQIKFVIGGDGPLRKELEAQAEGMANIEFLGWLKREQLIELLDASSLLLLPSKIETFGSVALEAMARGRPALVSANAGIHDWPLLKDGLFSLSPDETLSEAIARLITLPPGIWQEKAQLARQAAEQLNEETVQQWADVLNRYAQGAEAPSSNMVQRAQSI